MLRLALVLLLVFSTPAYAIVETFTTPGSSTWTAPTGVTSVQVECWGPGGAGSQGNATNFTGRGGGGGGGYAKRNALAVTPGNVYNYTVGGGGTDGGTPATGANTVFTGNASVQCVAAAGASVALSKPGGAGYAYA